jgi:FkbM family methyltransferase
MLSHIRGRVRKILADQFELPEIPVALSRLKVQGFRPKTICDVGAYRGDFAKLCIDIWPDTKVICFEPLKKEELLNFGAVSQNVTVYDSLLGATQKSNVRLFTAETASSVLGEHHCVHPSTFHEQTTLDIAVKEGCDFLKADVQGYELEVLRGAEQTLRHVGAILLELNLLDIHKGVPLMSDVVRWLDDRGFVAFDVCGLTRRPLDRALWQIDVIFVPVESTLRIDKRWIGSQEVGGSA